MIEHHRKLNRLKDYDYSRRGCYFVTICMKNRECILGSIEDSAFFSNSYGKIIEKYWISIPQHFTDVSLDEYIIMPNHIHSIIIIVDNTNVVTEHRSVTDSIQNDSAEVRLSISHKSTTNYGLLSKVIKSFKEICVKEIRRTYDDYSFGFQRSFYDHIVRSERSLHEIRKYINNNPMKWNLDENNPHNWKSCR